MTSSPTIHLVRSLSVVCLLSFGLSACVLGQRYVAGPKPLALRHEALSAHVAALSVADNAVVIGLEVRKHEHSLGSRGYGYQQCKLREPIRDLSSVAFR